MTSSTIFSERSVLYVEDEIIVAIEISEQLREIGFREVRVAHTLRTANELVENALPDVALLDVNLGNGERTTDLGIALRENGVKVVFASSYNKTELSERLQSFAFLEKPIGRHDVEAALRSLLS
ncbi:MAG: response regulator [Paracoccaceae bacterium]|nr:response regulator [Paracoccaceae bacterium]